jgi:hypothetical protein
VIGVLPAEKERLVNKVATVLDPPWWCPEVVAVPTGDGDKMVLVVRIEAETAPRPVLHKGAIRVRLDGRNAIADRRLARALFEESGPAPQILHAVPMRWVDQYQSPSNRLAPPPDVMVRAICSRSLRGGMARPRLGGRVADAVTTALSDPQNLKWLRPTGRVLELLNRGGRDWAFYTWRVDDQYLHSRFFRLTVGYGDDNAPSLQGTRIECSVEVKGEGASVLLEVWMDALFWCDADERLPAHTLMESGSILAEALAEQVLPAATIALIGEAMLPLPLIEFHVAGKVDRDTGGYVPLERFVALEDLGERVGSQPAYRTGEFLRPDLVNAGRWDEAAADAFEAMALDWRFLHPKI